MFIALVFYYARLHLTISLVVLHRIVLNLRLSTWLKTALDCYLMKDQQWSKFLCKLRKCFNLRFTICSTINRCFGIVCIIIITFHCYNNIIPQDKNVKYSMYIIVIILLCMIILFQYMTVNILYYLLHGWSFLGILVCTNMSSLVDICTF